MKKLVMVFGLLLLHSSLSYAAAFIHVVESEGNVVATASGSLNKDGLGAQGTTSSGGGTTNGSTLNASYDGAIIVGRSFEQRYTYLIDTPVMFSTGYIRNSFLNTGNTLGVWLYNDRPDVLYLDQNYVNGGLLWGMSTWTGVTLADLGLIVGTHVITWGSGATADSLTIYIGVDPAQTYSVAGLATGLTGTGLALQNNGSDTLPITGDGGFVFATALVDGADYVVTVSTQPTGQTCTVNNGSGVIATEDVTNVAVTCVTDVDPTYSVGGSVSGFTSTGLALQNNGADTLAVAGDGPFIFLTELTDTSSYAVTVSTQPVGQTCNVTNGSGTIATADVADVGVACVDDVIPPIDPPAPVTPIPTLSQWALIMLSMLLGLMAFSNRKRLF